MALRINAAAAAAPAGGGPAFGALAPPADPAQFGAMKIARTVLRNLVAKGPQDDKFRTLKTSNPKVAAKLLSQPAVVGFLTAVGFVNTGEALTFQGDIDVPRLQAECQGLDALMRSAAENTSAAQNAAAAAATAAPAGGSAPRKPVYEGRMSAKAQMRAKMEAMEKKKKAEAKRQRKALLKGFEQDKVARQQPGWTAKLSGANKGAAPSMQGSKEGNANLQAF
jgi:hypothetical protein